MCNVVRARALFGSVKIGLTMRASARTYTT